MSKWRYEVTKKNCNPIDTTQKYIVYCYESIVNYYNYVYSGHADSVQKSLSVWSEYTSDVPTRAVYDPRFSFQIQPHTYGNKKLQFSQGVDQFFPAIRIGRVFPRHKKNQIIIYK